MCMKCYPSVELFYMEMKESASTLNSDYMLHAVHNRMYVILFYYDRITTNPPFRSRPLIAPHITGIIPCVTCIRGKSAFGFFQESIVPLVEIIKSRDKEGNLHWNDIQKYAEEMASLLKTLHSEGLIHNTCTLTGYCVSSNNHICIL